MTEKTPEVILRFQLRLPLFLGENIKALAKEEGRSVNNLIRRILESACTKAKEQTHNKPLEDRKNA